MKFGRVCLLAAAMSFPIPALAAPGDMNVATFLAKADALQAKGLTALFSSDVGVLKAEGMAAATAYRDRLKAEKASGHPSSCPPLGTKLGSDAFMAHLRSYPGPARQSTSVKTAVADMMIKRYPCGK